MRISTSQKMHGDSLVPLLEGERPDDWRDAVYYHYQMVEPNTRTAHLVARHYGIRTAKHKLIYFYDLKTWELYDLDIDPAEMQNQYGRPEYVAVANRLKQQLQALRARFGDTSGVSF